MERYPYQGNFRDGLLRIQTENLRVDTLVINFPIWSRLIS